MDGLSSPFRICIYPNKGFQKDGRYISINNELSMDDFLRICSKILSSSSYEQFFKL